MEAQFSKDSAGLSPEERISAYNKNMTTGWLSSDLATMADQLDTRWLVADYEAGDMVPGGVIADGFYPKGGIGDPETLVKLVAGLLRGSASQVETHSKQSAPVWVPRNGKDVRGVPIRSTPRTSSSGLPST